MSCIAVTKPAAVACATLVSWREWHPERNRLSPAYPMVSISVPQNPRYEVQLELHETITARKVGMFTSEVRGALGFALNVDRPLEGPSQKGINQQMPDSRLWLVTVIELVKIIRMEKDQSSSPPNDALPFDKISAHSARNFFAQPRTGNDARDLKDAHRQPSAVPGSMKDNCQRVASTTCLWSLPQSLGTKQTTNAGLGYCSS